MIAKMLVAKQRASGRRGSTVVEFALVAPVFLLCMFMILELGLDAFTQVSLDDAVRAASRQIQIGNIQAGGANAFAADVCQEFGNIAPNCESSLLINVESGTNFASLTPATLTSDGTLSSSGFAPGSPGSDVIVQVAYHRPYAFPLIPQIISGQMSGTMMSTMVVQNEFY